MTEDYAMTSEPQIMDSINCGYYGAIYSVFRLTQEFVYMFQQQWEGVSLAVAAIAVYHRVFLRQLFDLRLVHFGNTHPRF